MQTKSKGGRPPTAPARPPTRDEKDHIHCSEADHVSVAKTASFDATLAAFNTIRDTLLRCGGVATDTASQEKEESDIDWGPASFSLSSPRRHLTAEVSSARADSRPKVINYDNTAAARTARPFSAASSSVMSTRESERLLTLLGGGPSGARSHLHTKNPSAAMGIVGTSVVSGASPTRPEQPQFPSHRHMRSPERRQGTMADAMKYGPQQQKSYSAETLKTAPIITPNSPRRGNNKPTAHSHRSFYPRVDARHPIAFISTASQLPSSAQLTIEPPSSEWAFTVPPVPLSPRCFGHVENTLEDKYVGNVKRGFGDASAVVSNEDPKLLNSGEHLAEANFGGDVVAISTLPKNALVASIAKALSPRHPAPPDLMSLERQYGETDPKQAANEQLFEHITSSQWRRRRLFSAPTARSGGGGEGQRRASPNTAATSHLFPANGNHRDDDNAALPVVCADASKMDNPHRMALLMASGLVRRGVPCVVSLAEEEEGRGRYESSAQTQPERTQRSNFAAHDQAKDAEAFAGTSTPVGTANSAPNSTELVVESDGDTALCRLPVVVTRSSATADPDVGESNTPPPISTPKVLLSDNGDTDALFFDAIVHRDTRGLPPHVYRPWSRLDVEAKAISHLYSPLHEEGTTRRKGQTSPNAVPKSLSVVKNTNKTWTAADLADANRQRNRNGCVLTEPLGDDEAMQLAAAGESMRILRSGRKHGGDDGGGTLTRQLSVLRSHTQQRPFVVSPTRRKGRIVMLDQRIGGLLYDEDSTTVIPFSLAGPATGVATTAAGPSSAIAGGVANGDNHVSTAFAVSDIVFYQRKIENDTGMARAVRMMVDHSAGNAPRDDASLNPEVRGVGGGDDGAMGERTNTMDPQLDTKEDADAGGVTFIDTSGAFQASPPTPTNNTAATKLSGDAKRVVVLHDGKRVVPVDLEASCASYGDDDDADGAHHHPLQPTPPTTAVQLAADSLAPHSGSGAGSLEYFDLYKKHLVEMLRREEAHDRLHAAAAAAATVDGTSPQHDRQTEKEIPNACTQQPQRLVPRPPLRGAKEVLTKIATGSLSSASLSTAVEEALQLAKRAGVNPITALAAKSEWEPKPDPENPHNIPLLSRPPMPPQGERLSDVLAAALIREAEDPFTYFEPVLEDDGITADNGTEKTKRSASNNNGDKKKMSKAAISAEHYKRPDGSPRSIFDKIDVLREDERQKQTKSENDIDNNCHSTNSSQQPNKNTQKRVVTASYSPRVARRRESSLSSVELAARAFGEPRIAPSEVSRWMRGGGGGGFGASSHNSMHPNFIAPLPTTTASLSSSNVQHHGHGRDDHHSLLLAKRRKSSAGGAYGVEWYRKPSDWAQMAAEKKLEAERKAEEDLRERVRLEAAERSARRVSLEMSARKRPMGRDSILF